MSIALGFFLLLPVFCLGQSERAPCSSQSDCQAFTASHHFEQKIQSVVHDGNYLMVESAAKDGNSTAGRLQLWRGGKTVLEAYSGIGMPAGSITVDRNKLHLAADGEYSGISMSAKLAEGEHAEGCFDIEWQARSSQTQDGNQAVTTCLAMRDFWFGGAQLSHQEWPVNHVRLPNEPYKSSDLYFPFPDNQMFKLYAHKTTSVLEPLWFTSAGGKVQVMDQIDGKVSKPYNVSINMDGFNVAPSVGKLCFHQPLVLHQQPTAAIRLCAGDNPHTVISKHLASLDPIPAGPPNSAFAEAPVWSTWARFKMDVDQSKVLGMARELLASGLVPPLPMGDSALSSAGTRGIIEIDDMWTPSYGELVFDTVKFPNPKAMVDELHAMGFKVTVWVMPFAERSSPAFLEGQRLGHWMREDVSDAESSAMVRWWHGYAALLNATSEAAMNWFGERLQRLQSYTGVDGFKFDAGEDDYVAIFPSVKDGDFVKGWVSLATRFSLVEVRVGRSTQSMRAWVRQFDKDSRWGTNNGLKSLITGALQFGLLGYPFVLPDMIGGNAYADEGFEGSLPTRELYVRWAQANVLLPAMQFSIAPATIDEANDNTTIGKSGLTVVELIKGLLEFRNSYLPTLKHLMEDAAKHHLPIVRPLFWAAPEDPFTYTIYDQFLVGDDILVAPVLEFGLHRRDVYLPKGVWRAVGFNDHHAGQTFDGGKWLYDYVSPLETLLVFKRMSRDPTLYG